jgi:hypothetical protein
MQAMMEVMKSLNPPKLELKRTSSMYLGSFHTNDNIFKKIVEIIKKLF